ncbi:SGNH/GDSL hydrolase family protein [Acinetobacter baumannii]|nr:SGNH/GDSL hydrolase family protein [Acinetobacter baumannii]
MSNILTPPFPILTDVDGSPLNEGFIFIGEKGMDPEANQLPVYWDEENTQPAEQPIRTRNGYIVKDGEPAKIFVDSQECSISVKNKNSTLILTSLIFDLIATKNYVKSQVKEESDRAIAAETTLQQGIVDETTRATSAEQILDSKINANGVGNRAYKQWSDMDADKANIPPKSKVTVTNDPNPAVNGDYQWDGVTFTKSAYDPLIQSKAYVDSNPLFKPIILDSQNLNDIKVNGLYIARTGTPTLAKNYPTTKPGYFIPRHIVTGSTGTLIPQTYMTFDGELWIRGTDSNGAVYQAWWQFATKADANKDPVALQNDSDVNTINKSGPYIIYSQPSTPTTTTNLPTAGEQYIIYHFEGPANVKRQIAYARGSNSVYVRWYWGSFGWSPWDKLALTSELNSLKAELTALIDSKTNLVNTFKLNLIDKLNGFNSVKLKLIGDSITWGVGASNTTATDPRTGYLTDPRNTTDPVSPTWANLFRKFLAYSLGDRTITSDAPGSAYAKRKRNISFKQEIKKFSFKNAAGATVSEATALQVITANDTARNGEVMNLLGLNFVSSRQNEFTFDIVSDNVSVVYKKWSVGDENDNIEVFVDGVSKGTFNYFSATESYENVFTVTFPYGKHTIRVKNQATNTNSYAQVQCCRTDQKIWLINEGIIGSSTKTWIDRNLFEGTINQYDDFVLMMLGTNDRATVGGESGFKTRLNTCIDKINTLSSNNSKLLLLTSAHVSDTDEALPSRYYNMQEVDAIISSVAKTRLVGHISQVKYTTQAKIDDVNIWSDGLHLNDAGNKLLYENLRKQLFDS